MVQTPLLMGKGGLPVWLALFIGNVVSVLLLNWLVLWTSRGSLWLHRAQCGRTDQPLWRGTDPAAYPDGFFLFRNSDKQRPAAESPGTCATRALQVAAVGGLAHRAPASGHAQPPLPQTRRARRLPESRRVNIVAGTGALGGCLASTGSGLRLGGVLVSNGNYLPSFRGNAPGKSSFNNLLVADSTQISTSSADPGAKLRYAHCFAFDGQPTNRQPASSPLTTA